MLPAFCAGPDVPDVCCEDLFHLAEGILNAGFDSLLICAGADVCSPMYKMVTVAEPHLMMQNYLAVWLDTVPRPMNRAQQARTLQVAPTLATYSIKLMESGYPTLETIGTEIHEPSTAEINFATMHSMAHAEAVYRGVLGFIVNFSTCSFLRSFDSLFPIPPQGGSVGWGFNLQVEM